MGSVRPAPAWNQPCQTLLRYGLAGLIERRPRQPEGRGSIGHGRMVDLDAAKHLVSDLQQVVRIEEVVSLEQRIGDSVRMRVEHALLAKRLNLCCIPPG